MKNFLQMISDLLMPCSCLGCKTMVSGMFCGECFGKLPFINGPLCEICGINIEYEGVCGDCLIEPLPFKVRAPFLYKGVVRDLILRLKHADCTELAPMFANMISAKCLNNIYENIVPVPLHKKRLMERKYNQSALIAQHIARTQKHIKVFYDGLERIKNTGSQGGLTYSGRHKNIKGAIVAKHNFAGANVTIVDDVMASGATLKECASALKKVGANNISVVTIARTFKQKEGLDEFVMYEANGSVLF